MPNARIIIADDDISSAHIKQSLDQVGHKVVACVTSGTEAEKQIKLLKPDLVVVNIELFDNKSDSDFIEVVSHNINTAFIYITSDINHPTLHQLKQVNFCGCVVKPFTPQQLQINIEVALQAHDQEPTLENQDKVDIILKRQNTELNLLNRASQVFISTLDLDQVLTSVLEEIQQHLEVVACSAWLVETDTQEVVCRQVTDPHSAKVQGWRLPLGQGLVGQTAATGQSIIVSDALADVRHFKGVDEQTGLKLRSILSIPLHIKDKTIGVIQIVDENVNRFNQSHLELVEPLAAIAAIVIENGRLYEESNQLRLFNENIVNNVEEGITIIDPHQRIVFINPKGASILGDKADQLIDQNILDFISADHQERVAAELARHQAGFTTKYETNILTKAGENIPIIFSANSLFEGEQFIGILAVFIDISQRKKTDELLRKLSRAVEQTADLMIITDKAGIIEYVNPAFQKLTGFTVSDVIGKTPQVLKFEQHDEKSYEQMWDTVKNGQVFRDIVINKKKEGSLFYEEQTITPIKDADGRITHFVYTGKDITERRLAEEALKEAVKVLRRRNLELDALNRAGRKLSSSLNVDEVLRAVLEEAKELLGALACSIWIVDPQTKNGQKNSGDLVCRQALGPHHEMVQGWRLSPGEGIAGWVAQSGESLIVADIAADQRHFEAVDQFLGLTLHSLISVPIKRVSYGVLGVLHVLDEQVGRFQTTDLLLVESLAAMASIAIENAQLFAKAQQDAKTKTVLLDEINHRVKNNLTAIIGLLFAEQSRFETNDNMMDQIIVKGLINRVQSLATVHSLLSDTEWAPLSLEQLAEQIIRSALQGLTLDQNVAVKISPSPVRVSPAQAHYLAMVVNELTTNAIKHGFSTSEQQPEIVVNIRQQPGLASDFVEFEFKDNGPGYPEAILQRHEENYSVGFDLIQNIVNRSLRGNLNLYNDNGAITLIKFEHLRNNSLIPSER